MLGNANGIDLNNSPLYELGRIGGLGLVLAQRIVENRPFRKWDDVKAIEGFNEELVNDLRGSGAKLGRITAAAAKRKSTVRRSEPSRPRRAPEKKQARGTLARNIFSGRSRDRK